MDNVQNSRERVRRKPFATGLAGKQSWSNVPRANSASSLSVADSTVAPDVHTSKGESHNLNASTRPSRCNNLDVGRGAHCGVVCARHGGRRNRDHLAVSKVYTATDMTPPRTIFVVCGPSAGADLVGGWVGGIDDGLGGVMVMEIALAIGSVIGTTVTIVITISFVIVLVIAIARLIAFGIINATRAGTGSWNRHA